MGEYTYLYMFDFERYQRQILPALEKRLAGGVYEPWMRVYVQDWGDTNVSLTSQQFNDPEWQRIHFVDHLEENTTYEVFLTAIYDLCVNEYQAQFIGKIGFASETPLVLQEEFGLAPDSRVIQLLTRLIKRPLHEYLVGHTHGIAGWLDSAETTELAQKLNKLPLPEYPPSFEVMAAIIPALNAQNREDYEQSNREWNYLVLSFIRTIAFIASMEGKYLLWGNEFSLWALEDWRDEIKIVDPPHPTKALKKWCVSILEQTQALTRQGPWKQGE